MPEILHLASFETPIGPCRVASTSTGLAHLELPRAAGRGLPGFCRSQLPDALLVDGYEPNRAAIRQILEFLGAKRQRFELPLDLRGTPFQRAVWQALLAIPYGETRSYPDVAAAVGRPRATRAVGSSNGANPLPLVVPCHRVVASGGGLGGYAGGAALKARLLAMERDALSGLQRPETGRLL